MSKPNEVGERLIALGVMFDADGVGYIDKEEMRPKLNPNDPVDKQIMDLINEDAFPTVFQVVYV